LNPHRKIEVLVFDLGETLVDETRLWSVEAERAGVSRLTFFAALGALIERGADHRGVWALLGRERPAGPPPMPVPGDLYPDALPCLAALRAGGYRVGIAANQPAGAIEGLGLQIDFAASSADWGVEKPDPAFFARVSATANAPAGHIAYVGDRLDNDVLPALRAGMLAIFVRRGPWGHIHAAWPEAAQADARVESLAEIPGVLAKARES
jgi:FMN phosphatase YigB (HAD superfamily)